MKKIKLSVHGLERVFSKEELKGILGGMGRGSDTGNSCCAKAYYADGNYHGSM